MDHQTHHYFIGLVIVLITLLLAACGGSNQLTYRVTGSVGEAKVTYSDAEGKSKTETVKLPWETGFSVGGNADFSLAADNTAGRGNISCVVLLNEKELGHADANYYAGCQGSFKKSGNSLSTNFSSRRDVLPDGSAAGPQATPTPVPPTATPVPSKPTAVAKAPTPTAAKTFANQPIVFASERDGNSEIYVTNIGDKNITRLTDNDVYDGEPTWSPDGKKIAFVSKRDGNYEIYTMNPDGSDVTRLTDDPANDFSPAWSPNSQVITFMTERDGSPDLYMMRADGSEPTSFLASKGKVLSPAWSYTSSELAFVSDQAKEGVFDLYIIDNQNKVRRITQNVGNAFAPNWSPNGRYIAFAADNGKNVDIYIIKPDGTGLQQVTDDKARDYLPKWSPDSKYIMFVSERDGNPDIYITDGADDVQRIISNKAVDTNPAWGPMKK
jgi:TolB protein